MIAFGTAITEPETFERCAEPGIRLVAEPDSVVLANAATGSIFRSYNLALDQARELDDLEALVLLHQDAELTDPEFCAKVRAALADPEVAIAGCAGATGQRSIAWWEGAVRWASFGHRYDELGGGEIAALTWPTGINPSFAQTGEVDAIDGVLIAMSPWAVANLRFDESLGGLLHGYDFDICCQARAAGRKVVTADLRVMHHHSKTLISDIEDWVDAYVKIAEKWQTEIAPADREEWQRTVLRARAEAAAAKLIGGMADLVRETQEERDAKRIAELEAEVERLRA